ncbi:MAG: hypothetical protein AAGF27_04830, partial [Pseudomonadota bacterium]
TIDAGPLNLLVPEAGGLTASPTPPLIWELTTGFRGTFRAEVSAPNGAGVVFEQTGAYPKGLYGLDLERSEMRLKERTLYKWRITLFDGGAPVARTQTLIERVPSDGRAPGSAGLWFDVLADTVTIDLSGRARVRDAERFNALMTAGGIEQ